MKTMEAEGRARAMMSLGGDVSGVSGWELNFLWGWGNGREGKERKSETSRRLWRRGTSHGH